MQEVIQPTDEFPYLTLPITGDKIVALTQSLIALHFTYGLGAKIVPLSAQTPSVMGVDEHGNRVREVDCSGFTRWCLFHALGQPADFDIPDGSVNQHEWADAAGLKVSSPSSANLSDGCVRIAFLSPEQGGGIGHVMLIYGGMTCESHGGKGVDRRAWGSQSFMSECKVYCVTAPRTE